MILSKYPYYHAVFFLKKKKREILQGNFGVYFEKKGKNGDFCQNTTTLMTSFFKENKKSEILQGDSGVNIEKKGGNIFPNPLNWLKMF